MTIKLKILSMNFYWKCKRTPPVPISIVAHVCGDESNEITDNLKGAVEQCVSELYAACDRSATEGLGVSCRFLPEMQLIFINIIPPCLRIAFMQQMEKNEKIAENFLGQFFGKRLETDRRRTSTGWEKYTN